MIKTQKTVTVSSGGGSPRIDPANLLVPEVVYLYPDGGSPISLAGNFDIQFTSYPDEGNETMFVWFGGDFDLNGNTMLIQSQVITQEMLNSNGCFSARTMGASGEQMYQYVPDFNTEGAISGEAILINSMPLNRLTGMSEGEFVVANDANVPSAVTLSGDVALANYTGVLAIQPGVIVNSMVNSAAAIARSKLANGSANFVVINSATGALSNESALAQVRGGFGIDVSASVGFFRFTGGGTEIGGLQDARSVYVSFDTAGQGTYIMYFNYPVTISLVRATVAEDMAATDSGTITLQDEAGTPMTGGVITLTASANTGTVFDCTPTTNNTPSAGTVIKLVVAKTTAGGTANVEVIYSRLTLS